MRFFSPNQPGAARGEPGYGPGKRGAPKNGRERGDAGPGAFLRWLEGEPGVHDAGQLDIYICIEVWDVLVFLHGVETGVFLFRFLVKMFEFCQAKKAPTKYTRWVLLYSSRGLEKGV